MTIVLPVTFSVLPLHKTAGSAEQFVGATGCGPLFRSHFRLVFCISRLAYGKLCLGVGSLLGQSRLARVLSTGDT